jgi:hypothetical protein
MKKLSIICLVFALLLLPAYVFASSCGGEDAVDPAAEDIAQFVEIMSLIGEAMDEDPPPCVDQVEGDMSMSITFNSCDFEGVIVDGTVSLTASEGSTSASINFSGTLTFTGPGAPASSVAFNFTLTVDFSSYPYSFAMSGTITIDDTVFNAAGFLNEFLYYYY